MRFFFGIDKGAVIVQRIEQLRTQFPSMYIDAFVVTEQINILYLTGFQLGAGDGCLLITSKGAYLITDDRYQEALQELQQDAFDTVITRDYYGQLADLCQQHKITVLGFESTLSYNIFSILDELMVCDIVAFDDTVEKQRSIKAPAEINKIRAAAELNSAGFDYLINHVHAGMTERDVANLLDWWLKKQGAARSSFDTIVASGPNAAKPHAMAGSRQLTNGDIVTVDFGYFLDGYTADITRTFGIGKLVPQLEQIYQTVLQASQAVIKHAVAGIDGQILDSYGRNIIKQAGYDDYFNHGMGHGIGMAIHELPASYGPNAQIVVQSNQIITVEPGIYLPHVGGVRIEDDILIYDHSNEVLTNAPTDLIIL